MVCFYFLESWNFLPKSLGLGFLTRISASLGFYHSLTHTLTWSPERGQPLDLSTASYQPSVQQSHLLRMPQYPSYHSILPFATPNNREFRIVHWGHDGKKARNFSILDRTTKQRTSWCTKPACNFFRRRHNKLLKKSFLFYTKNTNQKNKGAN